MPRRYVRLTFRLPPGTEEDVAADLWFRGTLGLELRQGEAGVLEADAYFTELPAGASSEWGGSGASLVGAATVPEEDWLAAYRKAARPFPLGSRFFVDPRDPPPDPASQPPVESRGRHLLRLPARTAFGTGSHASTRLALELLEEADLTGRRVAAGWMAFHLRRGGR